MCGLCGPADEGVKPGEMRSAEALGLCARSLRPGRFRASCWETHRAQARRHGHSGRQRRPPSGVHGLGVRGSAADSFWEMQSFPPVIGNSGKRCSTFIDKMLKSACLGMPFCISNPVFPERFNVTVCLKFPASSGARAPCPLVLSGDCRPGWFFPQR